MPFSMIPFLFLVIPLMEIGAFVLIGGQIGVFWTLAMVVVTAIIGSALLKVQGFSLLAKIQADMNAGRVPARELVHGVMIMIAGVLLLVPGFVTDGIGFLLFVPQFRDLVWHFAKSRVKIVTPHGEPQFSDDYRQPSDNGQTIDLDDEDFKRDPDPNSPWREKE